MCVMWLVVSVSVVSVCLCVRCFVFDHCAHIVVVCGDVCCFAGWY